MEISGTKSKIQCDIPENWKRVSVHGNITSQ